MKRFLFLSALFVFKASAQCGPDDTVTEAECLLKATGVDEVCCIFQEEACLGATDANGLAQFCPTTASPTTPDPTTRPPTTPDPTTAPPTTPAPTTAPPTTPAPTTAPPTTPAPTTAPPTTPDPTTAPPTTKPPTTSTEMPTPPPTTAAPTTTATTTTTTAPPTTRPPTTRPPTTKPPTTAPPTTRPPTTRPPTTKPPTTAPPTTSTTTTSPPTLAPTCICDDLIGAYCWCKTEVCPTPAPVTATTSSKKKKKAKGKKCKKKKKGSSVPGCGDCECDKSVGMTYMEVVNKGTETVNVEYFDKSGSSSICRTTGIERGDVSECDASHFGAGDFETNTVVKVTPTGGGSACTTEIHTSCSSTIIGTIGSQNCGIEVTKWADQNLCTNGYSLCGMCDKVETTKFTDVQNTVGEKCYCPTSVGLSSRRRLGKKKSSAQSSLGVSSSALGCECDKSTGMLVMRLRWSGPTAASSITLTGQKTGAFFCSFTNVAIGEEIECYASENGNSDYETNTDVVVTGATSCSGSVHTSCSKDIVGWTAEGCEYLLVTGWADGDGDCDDGFEECPCDAFTNAFRLSAAHDMVYKSVFALVMVAFVAMMV